jgi:autotransporter-associated beta strand protein
MKPEPSTLDSELVPSRRCRLHPELSGRIAKLSFGILTLCLAVAGAQAQSVNLRPNQVRVTVPIGSTDTTVISNILVDVNSIGSPVSLDVTGLPAGAGYSFTTTNGSPFSSTSIDTNVMLTVYTTNIAPGLHTFFLNASGGAVRSIPLLLQSAHIWNGTLDSSNHWASASSWLGGLPTTTGDVVFGTVGSQTNNTFSSGISFTNVGITASTTVGSLRFGQTAYVTADTTNATYHTLLLAPNSTLTVSGTNGFSLLRDTLDEFNDMDTENMGVNLVGGANSRLVVSNSAADFALLLGESQMATLNMSNLVHFSALVNRMGVADYKLYPYYDALNAGDNFGANPRQMAASIYLARSNFITALYVGPDNYTNEYTRTHAITTLQPGETQGQGSSGANLRVYLGFTNTFFADSFCIAAANAATGNNGEFRFNPAFGTNSGALFRGANGTSRMSVFTIGDSAGTNYAQSTVRANVVDFSGGVVNILADRFYMSRDRTLIASNQNPVVESQLTIGRGVVDVNTAILGFQEHDGKTNWTAIGGAEAYRNYCRADLTVSNGGVFRVNGTLTLGFTADTNPEAVAEQYNTRGTVTIGSGGTVMASNIVVDGGLNYTSISQARNNRITMTEGTLIVTNQIGAAPGLPLDLLSMTAATLNLRVTAGRTNVYVKNLLNLGALPSVVKISAVSGVTSYPTNIPLISYETAAPFITADISGATGLAAGAQGYILNNADNKTIDLFLTTNAPNTLVWRGNINNNWDLTTKNWVTAVGNSPTNFSLGDFVLFDDTAISATVDIAAVVVPAQSGGAGVTITNTSKNFVFNNSGGAIAGTASILKSGTGSLTFNGTESGPLTVTQGTLTGSGILGTVTVWSNVVVNYSGSMAGLTSTGRVTIATGGSVNGLVSLQGGSLVNDGTITTPNLATAMQVANTMLTNTLNGVINLGGSGNPALNADVNSVIANYGVVNLIRNRMNFSGTLFGNGYFIDSDGGLAGIDGRVNMLNDTRAFMSPGATLFNSIGSIYFGNRLDLHGGNPNNTAGLLWIEVDFSHPDVHDKLYVDRWNNIMGTIVMTNINPGAGSFAAGQTFRIFNNNNGINVSNQVDTVGIFPLILPQVPGPGLQWDLSQVREYGVIGVVSSPLVWEGSGGGTWDTNGTASNWKNSQIYTDSQGAVFNDAAAGTTSVNLNSAVAPAGFARLTNIVVGVSTNFMGVAPNFSPGIVFDNPTKNYTISGVGRITGTAGLYKRGAGTVSILTTNDFIGGAIIEGGEVEMGHISALGVGATSPGLNGAQGAYNQVMIDNATLRYLAVTNATLPRNTTLQGGGGTLDVALANTELTLGITVGDGALTKEGPGLLVLSQSGNAYRGGTMINEGGVRLNGANAGYGSITLAGGTLELTNSGAGFSLTNTITIGAGANVIANWKANVLNGPFTGSGSVTFDSASQVIFNGSMSGFSGTMSFGTSSGTFRFNNTTNNVCTGSAAAAFDLGTSTASLSNLHGGGLTYHLGALSGGANTILAGRSTNSGLPAGTTYSIGAKGTSTSFDGRIMDGLDTVSVTKVGAGSLFLDGTNSYTGLTTVTAGTLGGNGSLAGALTVQAGGTLAPGTSVGTFTVNGAVTLGGTTLMELNRSASPLKNDRLVASTITAGGALIVTNIGPDIANGTVFQLFSTPVSGFSSVVLPAMNPANTQPYVWNNTLAANGSIQLVSGGSAGPDTNPTNIVTSSSGGTLTLSWPSSHIGWQLWSNSVSLTSSNWFLISGSDATNQVQSAVDTTKTNVFYRLQLP